MGCRVRSAGGGGRPVDGSTREAVTIIHHPDVKRMLMTMRSLIEGARSVAYVAAATCDAAHNHPDETVRKQNQAVYEFLVPIVKGWSTELSIDVTSLGVQVHGGMGFITGIRFGGTRVTRAMVVVTLWF